MTRVVEREGKQLTRSKHQAPPSCVFEAPFTGGMSGAGAKLKVSGWEVVKFGRVGRQCIAAATIYSQRQTTRLGFNFASPIPASYILVLLCVLRILDCV